MFKSFKYRIYPDSQQESLIQNHFGCVRWVYNYALNRKISTYQTGGGSVSKFDLAMELPFLKKTKAPWLREVNSQSLQYSLERLDRAFTRFFRDKKGFPRFKSKKDNRQSFSIPQHVKIDPLKSLLQIPKFKTGIKIIIHREIEGKIKSATISKTPTGKYFVSILVETNEPIPTKKPIDENKAVGVDLGIKTFATLSDGISIENPKFLRKSLKKLKRLQRSVSRKNKRSENRAKAVKQLALIHEKVFNQRNDFLHKTTTFLVQNYETICLETLKPSNMVKNHKLAQALSDIAIGKFNELIEYKAEWYGKNILRIGQFEPSSKLCTCGEINRELKLSNRTWTCKKCNTTHDRDQLAANNIKRMAFHSLNKNTAGQAEIYA